MAYLFTSESVSEGHPDKVSDQISDALLDQFLAYDDKARCAIETFVTTGQAVIMVARLICPETTTMGSVAWPSCPDNFTMLGKTIHSTGYAPSTSA